MKGEPEHGAMNMRAGFVIWLVGTASLCGCGSPHAGGQAAQTPDPISGLAAHSPDWWQAHSRFLPVDLPPEATPEEIAFEALGHPSDYKVLKVREAGIKHAAPDPVAILVDVKDQGQMIVLALWINCRFVKWWTQVYEAN